MTSTSINIQPCKIGSSEEHNYRIKKLDYVRPELSHKNENWQSDNKTLSQHLDEIKTLVKEKTGRKLQEKATPIREGVVVINENTTLDELKLFTDACKKRWGIKPLQIHMHKDEGHMHENKWKSNLHAHIVFLWINEDTGKSIKMNSQDMAEMQTLLANTLKMERGISSDKKHLSSIQYKTEAEEKRLSELQEQAEELKQEIGDAKSIKEEINNAMQAQIKPINELIDENTDKRLFRRNKIDYEAVVKSIKEQERKKAILNLSARSKEQIQIEDLKTELSLTKNQLLKEKERADKSEKREENLCEIMSHYLGEKFDQFKEEVHQYWNKCISIKKCVYMWLGVTLSDNRGNKYSADRENGKLLINGKTCDTRKKRSLSQFIR